MSLADRARRLDMYSREAHSRVAPYILQVLMDMVARGKITDGDAVIVAMFLGATMISSAVAAYASGDAQEADQVIDIIFSWVRKDVGLRLEELNSLGLH